jgi:hypothetical protein
LGTIAVGRYSASSDRSKGGSEFETVGGGEFETVGGGEVRQ